MLFYIVFGAMVLSRRSGGMLFGIWILIVLSQAVSVPDHTPVPFIGSAYHLQFFMGIFAAWLVLTDRVPVPLLLASLGTVAFFATGVIEQAGLIPIAQLASHVLFGTAATLVVAGMAAAERQGRLRVGKGPAFWGGTSYSLYLVHTIAIGLTAKLLGALHLFDGMPGWLALVIALTSAVIAGSVVHVGVEQPLLRALRPSRRLRLALAGEARKQG